MEHLRPTDSVLLVHLQHANEVHDENVVALGVRLLHMLYVGVDAADRNVIKNDYVVSASTGTDSVSQAACCGRSPSSEKRPTTPLRAHSGR